MRIVRVFVSSPGDSENEQSGSLMGATRIEQFRGQSDIKNFWPRLQ